MKIESNIAEVMDRLQNRRVRVHNSAVELRHRLADIGVETAGNIFTGAPYPGTNDVTMSQEDRRSETVVSANGRAAPFIEFGTGIRYEPYPGELPPGIDPRGTHGQGRGANPKGWVYRGNPGTEGYTIPAKDKNGNAIPGVYRTWGNPPACAMLTAANDMREALPNVAEEVFRR